MNKIYTLAIESSCDETSVAILENQEVLSNIVSTQYFHSIYGGVIPELAARTHLAAIAGITQSALTQANLSITDINSIAVTSEPGLVGALLVGSNFAKGLSLKYQIPIYPINHIEGHLYSGHLQENNFGFPCISMVVSGGHTTIFLVKSYFEYEILGSTIDDAAGEAFDKIAKMLGLDYPGGALIDKLAKLGDKDKYSFPRSMKNTNDYNFSFSGLKTSVRYFLQKNFPNGDFINEINNIAASAQEAIVDVLTHKVIKVATSYNIKNISISGGVSANSRLREKLEQETQRLQINLVSPELEYCIDNAAMIGFIAYKKHIQQGDNSQETNNQLNPGQLKYSVRSYALRAR